MLELIARTLEHERRANLDIARKIQPEHCARRPADLAQSPCWIICHLCLADTLQTLDLLGQPDSKEDRVFFDEFGPDSNPNRALELMNARFGSWPAAITAASDSHRNLCQAIRECDAATLIQPHPQMHLRQYFATLADQIAYIIWHEGNHGGQLRAWLHAARHANLMAKA